MTTLNPISQISAVEVALLAEERRKLVAQRKRAAPLRYDGRKRIRRRRGEQPTKSEIVWKSTVVGECWIWKLAKTKAGYGRTGIDGIVHNAHCVALTLWKGPKPDGQEGCHKCDNPSCVNPAHLFWGTRSENVLDCVSKGRFNRPTGPNHHWWRGGATIVIQRIS